MGKGQGVCQVNKKSELSLAQGKWNLRAACPKGKLEFKFYSSLVKTTDEEKYSSFVKRPFIVI